MVRSPPALGGTTVRALSGTSTGLARDHTVSKGSSAGTCASLRLATRVTVCEEASRMSLTVSPTATISASSVIPRTVHLLLVRIIASWPHLLALFGGGAAELLSALPPPLRVDRDGFRLRPEEADLGLQKHLSEGGHAFEVASTGRLSEALRELIRPPSQVVLHELPLCIAADTDFGRTVVGEGVGLLVGQKVHELQLHAHVVQPLSFRHFQSEGTEKAGDIAQLLGLLEDVAARVERLARRAVQGQDVCKYPSVLGLKPGGVRGLKVPGERCQ